MIAFKRTPDGPAVRSGVSFLPDQWTLVEEPTEAQINEPGLLQMEVDGPDDPKLKNLVVRTADVKPTPDPEREITQDDVQAFMDAHDLTFLPTRELDALKGERDRLTTDLDKLKADNEVLETSVQEAEKATKDAAAGHKTEIAGLKEAHKAEIDKLKAELATAKKGN